MRAENADPAAAGCGCLLYMVGMLCYFAFWLAIVVGLVYVAAHFIAKVW